LTHATLLLMGLLRIALQISRTAPTSPPGVSSSTAIASAPAPSAIASRRWKLYEVILSIRPSMVMIATLSACRWLGTATPWAPAGATGVSPPVSGWAVASRTDPRAMTTHRATRPQVVWRRDKEAVRCACGESITRSIRNKP